MRPFGARAQGSTRCADCCSSFRRNFHLNEKCLQKLPAQKSLSSRKFPRAADPPAKCSSVVFFFSFSNTKKIHCHLKKKNSSLVWYLREMNSRGKKNLGQASGDSARPEGHPAVQVVMGTGALPNIRSASSGSLTSGSHTEVLATALSSKALM